MKSKVTKLEQWAKSTPDDYGNLPYNIEFENGDSGVYRGNPTKGLAFKIGEEADYEKEDVTAKSGKTYVKISKPKKDFTKDGWKPRKLTWIEIIRMARSNGSAASWKLFGKRDETFVNRVVAMVTYGIVEGDIEFNSDSHSLIISRMSATKNILEGHNVSWTADSFLKECMAEVKFIQG